MHFILKLVNLLFPPLVGVEGVIVNEIGWYICYFYKSIHGIIV